MKRMKYKQLGLLLVCSFFINCDLKNPKSLHTNNTDINIASIIENDIEKLKGKQLDFTSIINDTTNIKIVYLFNYYDCETCIYNGFKVVNQIDSLMGDGYVKVIESRCPEVNSLQRHVQYYGYIYSDKEDKIRKMLKYSPTPILLLMNESHQIRDACPFYYKTKNDKIIKQFIHKCQIFSNK